ncbi:MAG TPA: prepilin-type N-terminal cleavage/methylation domain-containing protein [Methylomirabilota bacterium]|jgi:general secretion pathway protein J
MKKHGQGFTLIEVLLALSIVAALMVIVSGGLRIGLGAWQRGEARTAKLDRDRSLIVLLEGALAGAFPYRVTPDDAEQPRLLFDGRTDRLTFATLSPPLPTATPASFSVVSLGAEAAGLTLRQQILPSPLPLDRLEPMLVDARTSAMRFRYLGEEPESWADVWDLTKEDSLPRAVEITLVTATGPRSTRQVFTVPIQAAGP